MEKKKQKVYVLKDYFLEIDGKNYGTKAYSEEDAHIRIRQADEWRKAA